MVRDRLIGEVFLPRIVRPMFADLQDGLPQVGSNRRSLLGVRPLGAKPDIDLQPPGDLNGSVVLNRKGMSVSADWRNLPGHLIPEELEDDTNGASGKGMKVYVHGSGSFSEGSVTGDLELLYKPNSVDSGVVCPVANVPLSSFQTHLAATRSNWTEDAS